MSVLLHQDWPGNRKLGLHTEISPHPQTYNVPLLPSGIFEIGDPLLELKWFLACLFEAYFYTGTGETLSFCGTELSKYGVLPQIGLASCRDPSCSTSTDNSQFI